MMMDLTRVATRMVTMSKLLNLILVMKVKRSFSSKFIQIFSAAIADIEDDDGGGDEDDDDEMDAEQERDYAFSRYLAEFSPVSWRDLFILLNTL